MIRALSNQPYSFTNQPCWFVLITLFVHATCFAELKLNSLFSDHGVIQQNQVVPVWGTSDPEAKVIVAFRDQKKEAKADKDGKWMVKLDALTANAEPTQLIATSGDTTLTISDLLVGEVWVCSGQSNMAMNAKSTTDFDKVQADIADGGILGNLRLFKVPVKGTDDRQASVEAKWTSVSETTAASFSAVGLYFGRALLREKRIPVGLIHSANGGTNAYSWINSDTVKNDAVAESIRTYWQATVKNGPAALEKFAATKAKWEEKKKAAKAAGTPFTGRAPREPMHANHMKRPAGHYNAMIAPLQPYAIAGAIWYQGEANSRPPFCTEYRDLMFALVEDWRADWATASGEERRDFPFYLVQLPNFAGGHAQGWPVVREQMLKFWQDGKNTGTVTSIDVGDPEDIHPKNKMPIGERLARFARANAYGADIVYSGPIYDSMQVDGNKVVLSFKHTGGGLKSIDGQGLRHFEVADADGNFAPATATIQGKQVVVTAKDIAEPRAVRYAWSNNPEKPNFVNQEDLVASPFRTDSWEIKFE